MWNCVQGKKYKQNIFVGDMWFAALNVRTRVTLLYPVMILIRINKEE